MTTSEIMYVNEDQVYLKIEDQKEVSNSISTNRFKDLYNKVKEYYKNQDIKVFVNGKKVLFDQEPIIKDGRTLVPLRKIFEALNATVEWDSTNDSVKVTKGKINKLDHIKLKSFCRA